MKGSITAITALLNGFLGVTGWPLRETVTWIRWLFGLMPARPSVLMRCAVRGQAEETHILIWTVSF